MEKTQSSERTRREMRERRARPLRVYGYTVEGRRAVLFPNPLLDQDPHRVQRPKPSADWEPTGRQENPDRAAEWSAPAGGFIGSLAGAWYRAHTEYRVHTMALSLSSLKNCLFLARDCLGNGTEDGIPSIIMASVSSCHCGL